MRQRRRAVGYKLVSHDPDELEHADPDPDAEPLSLSREPHGGCADGDDRDDITMARRVDGGALAPHGGE